MTSDAASDGTADGQRPAPATVYDAFRSAGGTVSLRRLPGQLRRAFGLVWTAARRELLWCLGLEVLGGGCTGAQLLLGRAILQTVVGASAAEVGIVDLAPELIALAVVTTLGGFAASALAERHTVLGELVERHVQGRIVDVVTAVELEAFDRPSFYDRLQRARVLAAERSWQVVYGVAYMAGGVIGIISLAGVLLSIQPLVVPLMLLACVPLALAMRRNSKAAYEFSFAMTPEDRERAYLQGVLTGKPEAKELRLFGLAGFLRGRYERLYDRRIAELRRVVRRRMRRSLAANAASTALTLVGVGVLLQLTLSGRLSGADAAVAALAVAQLGGRLRALNASAGTLHECSLFLDDLASFLDLEKAVHLAQPTGPGPRHPTRISAEHVSFAYPATGRLVLEDVCIEIDDGEIVALVGRNGSGKSTLAKILCGLYTPTAGRVLWDGDDVAKCDPAALRAGIAAIFQDFVHYELLARDNVALGDSARFDDLAAIKAAARLAGADGFVADLPAGFDTRLGRAFEGGSELSIGQWQRIALARAFFRDAPFLVLDEPTAALDAEAEQELFECIRTLQKGRAVLLISHRFSSVRLADRIYVLDDGRVTETGTHDELVAHRGRYADLFSRQAAAYGDDRDRPRDLPGGRPA